MRQWQLHRLCFSCHSMAKLIWVTLNPIIQRSGLDSDAVRLLVLMCCSPLNVHIQVVVFCPFLQPVRPQLMPIVLLHVRIGGVFMGSPSDRAGNGWCYDSPANMV